MALQKQHLPILVGKGIDTKSDPKAIESGKLAVLQNGVFDKDNRINKRPGTISLGTDIIGGGSITEGQGLFNFNNELGLVSSNEIYSYDDNNDQWASKGSAYSVTVDVNEVYKGSGNDLLILSNLVIGNYSYTLVSDYVDINDAPTKLIIEDISTGNVVKNEELTLNTNVTLTPDIAKLINIGGTAYIYFTYYDTVSTNLVRFISIDSTTLALGSPNDVTLSNTDLNPITVFAITIGSDIYIGYGDNAGTNNNYGVSKVTAFAEVDNDQKTQVVFTTINKLHMKALPDDDGFSLCFGDSGAYALVYDLSLTQISNSVFQAAASGDELVCIYHESEDTWSVISKDNDGTLKKKVQYLTDTVDFNDRIALYLIGESDVIEYNSEYFILSSLPWTNETGYFLMRDDGYIVARMLYGKTKSFAFTFDPLRYFEIDDGIFYGPSTKIVSPFAIGAEVSLPDVNYTTYQSLLTSFTFNFKNTSSVYNSLSDQLGLNSHMVGGILQAYDGKQMTELNFLVLPRILSSTSTTSGIGNTLGAGVYLGYVVFKWIDNKGQTHKSAPSYVDSETVASPSSKIVYTIYTPYATNKIDPESPIFYEVYVTTAGGTIPYLSAEGMVDDLTAVSFDVEVKAVSSASTILYTQSGILDNLAPPSSKSICNYKNRAVLGGTEDGDIYFSKEWVQGEGVAFALDFIIPMDRKSGKSTAVATLDDKLVIFKKSNIYVTAGEGPLDTGAQYDYLRPQEIPTNVGCTEPESVLSIPQGIMFKGVKGFYLLSRGLEVIYIGRDVEQFNSLAITGAVKRQDENYAVFTTNDSSIALTYNWENGQWGTFTNYAGEDIILWQEKLTRVLSDGTVKTEQDSFVDDSSFIKMRIVSGWITLQGILAYYRIYQTIILGVYISDHKLRIGMGYDYEPDFTDYNEFDSTNIFGPTVLPVPYYGAGVYYGDAEKPFTIRYQNTRQKNTSFRIAIEDMEPASSVDFGEGYSITGLGLLVGVKRGSFKISAAQSIGKI